MGQCCSAQADSRQPRQKAEAGLSEAGLADRALYPIFNASGALQLAVSQARCAAAAGEGGADTTPVLVRQTPQGVLVALFEGLGSDRRSVAAFCRSRVLELFQESCVRHPGSPLEALKDTLERLDAAIFATDRLRHATKASSGASAVLLLVDPEAQRCYCANVGAALCLLSRITGSFNAKTPEGFFLTREHTTRSREEMVRLQRRLPGEVTPQKAAAGAPGDAAGSEEPQAMAPTRALGFMDAKRQAGGSGALVCEAYATDHSLTGTDQHLVLGSAAFWQLVGPTDCALRAHFHEKFAKKELDRAAALATAAAAAGVQDAPSPSLLQAANTAEHLVYWSLEKATRKLGKLQQQQQKQRCQEGELVDEQAEAGSTGGGSGGAGAGGAAAALPPSVADLLALPLERPPLPPPELPAALSQGGEAAAAAELRQLDDAPQQPQQLLVRSDVVGLGDLGVVVVTLRRQSLSMDGGMREVLMEMRARIGAGGQGGSDSAAGANGSGGYVERLARRRWAQVRMLVDFYKAHRRQLLRQWWEAQDALYRRHRISGTAAGRIKLGSGVSPAKLGGGISPPKLPGGVCAAKLAAAAAAKVAAKKAARAAAGGDSSPTAALGSSNIKAVRPGSARK